MHKSTTFKLASAMAVFMAALTTLFGLANSGTIATAQEIGETGKIYYLGDNSKQELFRTRPAPGAILPGEHGYNHLTEEVVAVWEDGTRVLKNAIVIHPDGSVTLPEMYHETPEEDGGWYREWFPGEPSTSWNDETQTWDIVYNGPFGMEKTYPSYYVQPYVDDEGIVHEPGSDDYHPELYGMWGFVPPVLRPEGYEPGVPWPTELDWSKLDELTAKANGTSWDSTTVFDRWADGTKIYGNGLILHPNGVYHTPSDWVDHDEEYSHLRYIHVYFDEQAGEWSVYYTETELPVPDEPMLGEPPVWDGDEVNDSTGDDEVIWSVVPDVEDETDVAEPVKAEDSESTLTSEETEELAAPIMATLDEPEVDATMVETVGDYADQVDGVVDTSETRSNHLHDVDLTDPSETVSDSDVANESLTSEPMPTAEPEAVVL